MLGDQGRLGPGLVLCSRDGWGWGAVGGGGGRAGDAWNGSSRANISRSEQSTWLLWGNPQEDAGI